MSNGIDAKFVQERYEKMSNDELIYLVTHDGAGLTPAALVIAKNEIAKRGLKGGYADALEMQNKTYTIEEIDAYCSLINDLKCPICGERSTPLNGTVTTEVISFILMMQTRTAVYVGCPDCLDDLSNAALNKTVILGWWSFWGIFKTIGAIIDNIKYKRANHYESPNIALRYFVLSHIGLIELHKNDRTMLDQLIAKHNMTCA
ncbi:MAG: hypothetical protein J7623_08100 [Chitinophaga sp.]|uniref:hypothetical protein n=1 Tax=Chitinophaga sp. TaxID=1869181 RepID=UPI001B14BCDE|nr:hypothetical protein [Chitinophaga sp.]MBO9728583.1 hypothetical protein [Chitinophaga sp.]